MAILILIAMIVVIFVINSNNASNRAATAAFIMRGDRIREMTTRIDRKKADLKEIDKSKNYSEYNALRREIEDLEAEYARASNSLGY